MLCYVKTFIVTFAISTNPCNSANSVSTRMLYADSERVFYASAQCRRPMARGIMFTSCSSVCASVRPETMLTLYREKYLTDFHQTYINDAFRHSVTFWVKRSRSRWDNTAGKWKQYKSRSICNACKNLRGQHPRKAEM